MVRLQKILAQAGIASRRASERIIAAGRVAVNGKVVREMGVKVEPGRDEVAVDGRAVGRRARRYIALQQTARVSFVRGRADERRNRIGDLLPKEWSDLFSVGRLDYQSEGLIFLTNDGDFCLKLTHPRYRITKTYVAQDQGRVKAGDFEEVHARRGERGREIAGRARASHFRQQHEQHGGTGIDRRKEPRGAAAFRVGKLDRPAFATGPDRAGQTGRVARGQMAGVDRTGD